ncbi:MAG TPA: DUF2218 domain-containing protein [Jatrophihabitans sp.]|jgi:hypothetical protein
MSTSSASVATDRPGRYAKQLASHLSRRTETGWDETAGRGWVTLGTGRAELVAADGSLDLSIEADEADLARFEDVLGRHLVRFGTKDELIVQWTRGDGTPGSTYRHDPDDAAATS